MIKYTLHSLLIAVRQPKMWHLVAAFGMLLLLSAFFLRQNNLHMITLRNLTLQADEQNQNIPQTLTNLRNYIATHMNASLTERGIYLEHSYQRAFIAAIQQMEQGGVASATIYRQIDNDCQSQSNPATSFPAYAQCLTDKIAASGMPAIKTPSADLYRFNFVSPRWSPDVAGFTVLLALFAALLIVVRLALRGGFYVAHRGRL